MAVIRSEWLGRLAHSEASAAMERARSEVLAGDESAQVIWLCEHSPVITMGRGASRDDVLASDDELAAAGIELAEASRGGQVTYHGPGQLMVYPVVRLERGLIAFLEAVAGALASVSALFGVDGAEFRRDPAGLWVGDRKLAACGVHLRKRVSIHGFALNVATPQRCWDLIVPCGLAARPIASIASLSGRDSAEAPSVADVAAVAGPILSRALATSKTR